MQCRPWWIFSPCAHMKCDDCAHVYASFMHTLSFSLPLSPSVSLTHTDTPTCSLRDASVYSTWCVPKPFVHQSHVCSRCNASAAARASAASSSAPSSSTFAPFPAWLRVVRCSILARMCRAGQADNPRLCLRQEERANRPPRHALRLAAPGAAPAPPPRAAFSCKLTKTFVAKVRRRS